MLEQLSGGTHDREAEAMPEVALAGGVADLEELLEDCLQLVLGDTDAGVPDLDPEPRATAAGAEQDLAGRGALDGVADQVLQDALEQARVGAHHRPARHHFEREPLGGGQVAELAGDPLE